MMNGSVLIKPDGPNRSMEERKKGEGNCTLTGYYMITDTTHLESLPSLHRIIICVHSKQKKIRKR
jgi:hypothetical protein